MTKIKGMREGWIKLHRSLLEWEWYNDNNVFRLFTHMLLMANHNDKKYKGMDIKRGSFITGRDLLASQTGLTVQQIRTAINKLKSTNEITINSNSQGTEIQIVNYCKYQQVTNKTTNEQPTSNQQVTTNKNEKNEKNERKIIPPPFHLVEIYAKSRGLKVNIIKFYDHYESKGWMIGKGKMKDWQAAYRTWEPEVNKQIVKPKFQS